MSSEGGSLQWPRGLYERLEVNTGEMGRWREDHYRAYRVLLARRIPVSYLRCETSTVFLKQGTTLCSSRALSPLQRWLPHCRWAAATYSVFLPFRFNKRLEVELPRDRPHCCCVVWFIVIYFFVTLPLLCILLRSQVRWPSALKLYDFRGSAPLILGGLDDNHHDGRHRDDKNDSITEVPRFDHQNKSFSRDTCIKVYTQDWPASPGRTNTPSQTQDEWTTPSPSRRQVGVNRPAIFKIIVKTCVSLEAHDVHLPNYVPLSGPARHADACSPFLYGMILDQANKSEPRLVSRILVR
jgi:hypothetical protein